MRDPNALNDNSPGGPPSGRARKGGPVMDEALDWFTRLQSGEADAAAKNAFADWLDADPAHAEAFRRVEALWAAPAFSGALARHEASGPANHTPKPARRRWVGRIAAVAAVMLLACVSVLKGPDVLIALEADAAAPIGERRSVMLSDGSEVILNTGAAMSVAFDGDVRRIDLLKGEAYFDVISDAARPFVVVAGDANIRVVGTRFSVRRDGGATRVAVAEGVVRVAGAGETSPVELRVGDGVVVAGGRPGTVERIDADRTMAWLDGRLRFHDRPLGDVLQELDRYHAGWIGPVSERARTARVSGNYRLDDPAAVARALADAASLDAVGVDGLVLMLR